MQTDFANSFTRVAGTPKGLIGVKRPMQAVHKRLEKLNNVLKLWQARQS